MTLLSQVESILFIAGKALSIKEIAHLLNSSKNEITTVLSQIQDSYEKRHSGIRIVCNGHSAEMVTAPENSAVVKALNKHNQSTITQAKIETLTILAYTGPHPKEVLENIRGVNCTLILKNLMIEELVEEYVGKDVVQYSVSTKFLKGLGVQSVQDLPCYADLSKSLSQVSALNA